MNFLTLFLCRLLENARNYAEKRFKWFYEVDFLLCENIFSLDTLSQFHFSAHYQTDFYQVVNHCDRFLSSQKLHMTLRKKRADFRLCFFQRSTCYLYRKQVGYRFPVRLAKFRVYDDFKVGQ